MAILWQILFFISLIGGAAIYVYFWIQGRRYRAVAAERTELKERISILIEENDSLIKEVNKNIDKNKEYEEERERIMLKVKEIENENPNDAASDLHAYLERFRREEAQ